MAGGPAPPAPTQKSEDSGPTGQRSFPKWSRCMMAGPLVAASWDSKHNFLCLLPWGWGTRQVTMLQCYQVTRSATGNATASQPCQQVSHGVARNAKTLDFSRVFAGRRGTVSDGA